MVESNFSECLKVSFLYYIPDLYGLTILVVECNLNRRNVSENEGAADFKTILNNREIL